MADKGRTEIAVILDRSGSMQSIRDDMVGGLASFVEGQRKEPGTCTLSLYQFDDTYEVMFEAMPLRRVPAGS